MPLTIKGNVIKSVIAPSVVINVAGADVKEKDGIYTVVFTSDYFAKIKGDNAALAKHNDCIELEVVDDNKQSYPISGGTLTADADGKITVADLKKGKQLSLEISASMNIGSGAVTGGVAKLNVSIGNWNADRDWIIDMSDNRDNNEASTLNISALMAWINKNNGNAQLSVPGVSKDDKKSINDLVIEFRKFNYNITKGEFDIDIRTKGDSKNAGVKIFENLELTNIGFKMTNMKLVPDRDY